MPAKDYSTISAIRVRLEAYYSRMRAQMDRAESLYHLEYGPEAANTPEGMSTHVPSTAPSVVDATASQIRTDSVRVRVIPNGSSAEAAKKAQKQERLAEALLARLGDSYDVSIPQQELFDFSLLGAGVVKSYYDADLLPEDEDEREYAFPFYCAPSDPRYVLIPPGTRWPYPYAVEFQQRRPADVMARYPYWSDPKRPAKDGPGRMVEWLEYWEKDTYQIFADGEEIRRDKKTHAILRSNPVGNVPYTFSFSGLGARRVGSDPADAAIGMLTKVESELRAEVRLKTALDVLWQMFVYPRLLTTADPETVGAQMDMRAGGVIQWRGEAHEKPDFLAPPQPNQVMYALLPELQASIQRGTLSETLTGERPRGVDYGYLQSLLVGQARLRIGPMKQALETMLQRVLLLLMQQLRFRGQTVSVFGVEDETAEGPRRVKPADLSGHIELRVEFTPGKPMDDRNAVISLLNVVGGGYMSPRTYIKEILGLDPDEEQAHILAWRVVQQAISQGYLLPELMEHVGLQGELAQGKEALGQAQQTVRQTLQTPGAREGAPILQDIGGIGTP